MKHHSTTFMLSIFPNMPKKIALNIAEIVGFIFPFRVSVYLLETAIFEYKDLKISSLNIEIRQDKRCRGFIRLPFSCCSLSMIRLLTCLKRALKCTACIEFKLKISEPEPCSSFISKIQYYTLKSTKIKVLDFTFIYTFSFRHILKFGL